MEIVVKGRRLSQDVGDSFRSHCTSKLTRLDRLDHRIRRIDVELSHEPNPRLAETASCLEITVRSRGPVVRAEASAADCYAAFDKALDRLEERMRRAADRRGASHSHSHHAHVPVTAVSLASAGLGPPAPRDPEDGAAASDPPQPWQPGVVELDGGLLVREKHHDAEPMTLDEALHRMELVGHDFYLFLDAASGCPSVAYRRRGYSYGVLRLGPSTVAAMGPEPADGERRAAEAGPTSQRGPVRHPSSV